MAIGKGVWVFDASSKVEAGSAEQLDGVSNMSYDGMNLLPGISVLLSGRHACPVTSRIPVGSGLAAVIAEVYKIVYIYIYIC